MQEKNLDEFYKERESYIKSDQKTGSNRAQVQDNQLTAQESAGKEERTVENRTTANGQAETIQLEEREKRKPWEQDTNTA